MNRFCPTAMHVRRPVSLFDGQPGQRMLFDPCPACGGWGPGIQVKHGAAGDASEGPVLAVHSGRAQLRHGSTNLRVLDHGAPGCR